MTECIADHCTKGVTHQHLPDADGIGQYIHAGYCFGCAFWQAEADHDRTSQRVFVAVHGHDGTLNHYTLGTSKAANPKSRGSYGKNFRVELTYPEGPNRIVGTNDLWHQGRVPEEWEHLFDLTPRGRFL